MKILRSRKALSPVVASIILIAVTVAVSIAVAAWMGALTFNFMATEQGQIWNLQFTAGNPGGTILVTFNNTGTTPITLNQAWVKGIQATVGALPQTVTANNGTQITITMTIISGASYEVKLTSSKGNTFLRTGVAPS
ncbi:MAG: archaellin/type IV pilin N-terminal domain-containing protein [Candidatus Bathyarchaeia archaeon]